MNLNRIAVACLVFSGLVAEPLYASGTSTCFPRNKLHLRPSPLEKSNITERKFNEIITQAEKIYAPVVKEHRAKLKINRLWKDDTVNASAVQDGNKWEVNMFGGLARRPEVTPDGFALVLCHELGHHLGGYVMVSDEDMAWASNEGQSDYFASEACAKEFWRGEPEVNATHRTTVLPFAKSVCDTNYAGQAERDLCYRTSNAGLSLATLLATLRGSQQPKFETPSKEVVSKTSDDHPEAQCRLDTYLAGAACSVPFNRSVIPGKGLNAGGASEEAERLAGQTSCLASEGWVMGQRPRCWFKPFLEFDGLISGGAQWSEASGNNQAEPGETLSLVVPLENQWSKVSNQVSGELFSLTPGVKVVQAKVNYPDIQPGERVTPSAPFQIKVAKNFTCGHPFELLFRANGARGSREYPVRWFVGPKQAADAIIGQSTESSPIDDYPSPGVSVAFEMAESILSSTLQLQLKITGYYPEEIAVTLTSPDGQVHTLKTDDGFDEQNTARVTLKLSKPMNLRGKWTLSLRDMQENDTHALESFELRAPFAEKVACAQR